ncbi:MAG: hypothetical protein ACI4XA_10960 [Oscillospiraceae bacterium]
MKYDAKNLRINSLVLIILSIVDTVIMIGQIMADQLSAAKISELADTTQQIAEISVTAFICANSVVLLVTLFIGIMGFRQADGKFKGKVNIVLAEIMFVINFLMAAVGVYGLIKGSNDFSSVCQSVLYIAFYYAYIKCAKNV